jgi:hypothetical protein
MTDQPTLRAAITQRRTQRAAERDTERMMLTLSYERAVALITRHAHYFAVCDPQGAEAVLQDYATLLAWDVIEGESE